MRANVFSIDAATMRHRFKGVVFSMTILDADGRVVSLASGLHIAETIEAWEAFLGFVKDAFKIGITAPATGLTDRPPGLDDVWENTFSSTPHPVDHLACTHHLRKNVQKKFGAVCANAVHGLARQGDEAGYKAALAPSQVWEG